MSIYRVVFKFKNDKTLEFKIETQEDLLKKLSNAWDKTLDTYVTLGDYIISMNDILWVNVEGEKTSEEHSGK